MLQSLLPDLPTGATTPDESKKDGSEPEIRAILLPEDRVLRTRKEAMRYLRRYKKVLEKLAENYIQLVQAIEDPDKKVVVLLLIEALAANEACFHSNAYRNGLKRDPYQLQVEHIDMDEDLADALEEQFGDELVQEASRWLFGSLASSSLLFVLWALGEIKFTNRGPIYIAHRLGFDIKTRKFIHVTSHHDPHDPRGVRWMVQKTKDGVVSRKPLAGFL